MSFPHYPNYKDSGVEWLGEVPEHWKVCAFKHCARLRYGDALAAEVRQNGNVKVYGSNGAVGTHCVANTKSPAIVVGRKGSFGKVVWAEHGGFVIDTAYTIDEDTTSQNMRWLFYVLQSMGLDLHSQDTGVPGLAREKAYTIEVAIPPPTEQICIATFLDYETAKIDGLLEEQWRLMDLLTEKITSLVLSSINSTDSQEVRLENATEIVSRPVIQREGELYTPIGLFNRGRGLFHKDPREMADMGDSDFFWIEDGDLIISGQFAWEGAIALAGGEDAGCVVSHRYPVLRGKPGTTLTEYLLALLSTKHGDFLLSENSRGAAGRNRPLNINSLLKEKVPVPGLQTQSKVAQAVHRRNNLFKKISKQVELLNERKATLISTAVTGQIDVRQLTETQAL